MTAASPRARRLSLIRDVLQHHRVQNQSELLRLLAKENVAATQATLSRDLRALGALKGADGYTLGGSGAAHAPAVESLALAGAVQTFLISARNAGNLVVLRTGPGQASALANQIDNALPNGAVGTIAGDDTVFVAASTPSAAGKITRSFVALATAG